MRYYLIAGEASGDLHASNLMKSLKAGDRDADFRFFGGDLMLSVGGTLVKHYRDLAYMGFIPVLLHLRTIFKNLHLCKQDIIAFRPDVVILIDYPGFNLKIARFVKEKLQIPLYYYISPKIWAWKEGRIKTIRKYVDKMLCIFPFEVDFYEKYHYPVQYVGNPTVDAVTTHRFVGENFEEFIKHNGLGDKPIIALLAGSRKQEIKDNLPSMLEASATFTDYQIVIAGAPGIDTDYYRSFTGKYSVGIVFNQTYRLLQQAAAALVTSGTATLETALFRVPQAVCYKTPLKQVAGFIWKHFFKVRYISLVNLIAGKEVVYEIFNETFSVKTIKNALNDILYNVQYVSNQQLEYERIIEKLGEPGASEQAAGLIISSLRSPISAPVPQTRY
ncbi:MAG: lipid-A-disaccharide synthase [Dysgonamonadaceae bacterium]|jgi:lipid-A-disaccharide synthase|nr:lipid-A-disaccharide synthase [Dysgonamonadaceae bacterium]